VIKEANALARAGYDITVVGATFDPSRAAIDASVAGAAWKYLTVLDAASRRVQDRMRWKRAQVRRKLFRELQSKLKFADPRQLGYAGREVLRYCTRHPADLYIVHNPQSLWVGVKLAKKGHRVAVDFEDWYSRDVPTNESAVSVPLLVSLERELVGKAAFVITPSESMSRAIAEAYGCERPVVVYNSFPVSETRGRAIESRDTSHQELSVVWFSQVAGKGRGLETLMDALREVRHKVAVRIVGTCSGDYASELLARAPSECRERITFEPQVHPDALWPILASSDIGYSGELTEPLSRQLTITNKILQYLQAGLPSVASDTSGNREVADKAGAAVTLFAAGNARSLAAAINELGEDRKALADRRNEAQKAAELFSWERSSDVLRDRVRTSLG
jgi:glycosyltransferase involved in cell wall biosynthesis